MDRINEATIYDVAKDPRMYTMTKPFISIYVAKPEQGKSVAIKYLIHRMCSADIVSHGWVYTGTAFNKDYSYLPAGCVTSVFSIDGLKQILKYQSVNPDKKPAFIVFDDMVAYIPWKDKNVRSLFMNFRHYNIRLIVASQYFRAMDAQVREQTTFYVVFGKQADLSLTAIAEGAFAGKRKIEVANILRANCVGFTHLICDLNADDPNKEYLRYCVPLVKDMKIAEWWQLKNKPKNVKCGMADKAATVEAKPRSRGLPDTKYDGVGEAEDSMPVHGMSEEDDDTHNGIKLMVTRPRKK